MRSAGRQRGQTDLPQTLGIRTRDLGQARGRDTHLRVRFGMTPERDRVIPLQNDTVPMD